MNVYAMAGTIGSGKSTISKMFAQVNNMIYVSTGDYLRRITLENGYDICDRRNISKVFNEIIKYGWENFCKELFDDLKCCKRDIVIDCIKGKESYLALKNFYNNTNVYLIYCHIDEDMSILRQFNRGDKYVYEYKDDLVDFDNLTYLREEANIILDTSGNIDDVLDKLQVWYNGRNYNGRI